MGRILELQGNILPIETRMAQGYSNNALIGTSLLPEIIVPAEEFQYPTFGKDHLKVSDTKRGLRGHTPRIAVDQITYTSAQTYEHDLGVELDYREEAAARRGGLMDLRKWATFVGAARHALELEKEIAAAIQTTGSYAVSNKNALTGNDCWDSSVAAHADSVPYEDIIAGIEAVQVDIGHYPNVAWCGPETWVDIITHPDMHTLFFGTGPNGIITKEMFAKKFEFDAFYVGYSYYDVAGTLTKLWSDNFGMLYNPQLGINRNSTDMFAQTGGFGFVSTLKDWAMVDEFTEDGGKIRVVRHTQFWNSHFLNYNAGYIISNTRT